MECPRCDGQGNIYRTNISDLNEILFICDECEACWTDKNRIQLDTFIDLTIYLKSKGVDYIDCELKEIEYNI